VSATTFIIIDDNVIDILTHKIVLKAKLIDPNIIDFTCAQNALQYIEENYSKNGLNKTILLLDLNMPGMNGWEFLERFKKLDKKIKNQVKIFIVSFSIDPKNEERAALDPYVELFISKPLTKEKLTRIFNFQPAT